MLRAKEVELLSVMKGDDQVGTLKRLKSGYELSFEPAWYNKVITYQIRGSATPLKQLGESLPSFFANLLPEGYRLKALREEIKTSEDDLFSLLVASGGACIGDVYVRDIGQTLAMPIIASLSSINFHEFFLGLANQGQAETLSGVQDKLSASMISFPVGVANQRHQYILKLNPPDKLNLVENEFACMTLAKKCKIDVAKVKLVSDKDHHKALLVERFDRVWNEHRQSFEMIHQEDGCQMLGVYPSQKYRVRWGELANAVSELTGANPIELLKLLKLYVFSYLIGNGDLHAKNVSLYDLPGCPRTLTPAYDLLSTRIYGDEAMALKFDGKDRNLTQAMVLEFGKRFGLPEIAVSSMLQKLLGLFLKHQALLFSFPMTKKQEALLKEMITIRVKDLSG